MSSRSAGRQERNRDRKTETSERHGETETKREMTDRQTDRQTNRQRTRDRKTKTSRENVLADGDRESNLTAYKRIRCGTHSTSANHVVAVPLY